jgi:hypothetical protein
MQLSYSNLPAVGRPGMAVDTTNKIVNSGLASGIVRAGLGVFRSPGAVPGSNPASTRFIWQNPTGGSGANTTAIIASGLASSASIQTLTAANGSVGLGVMAPARRITLILSNHANWSATTAVITFVNAAGRTVSENLSIPSGGNTTLTTVAAARQFVSLVIPAQGGTSGTATVGIAALDATVDIADFEGIALFDPGQTPGSVLDSNSFEYANGETVPMGLKGKFYATVEGSPTVGAAVYVRIASGSGGSQIGAFRLDADSSTAVLVPNARFESDFQAAVGGAAVGLY